MAETAKNRLDALSKQLEPVKTVGGPSTGPRLKGKVIIITGMLKFFVLTQAWSQFHYRYNHKRKTEFAYQRMGR